MDPPNPNLVHKPYGSPDNINTHSSNPNLQQHSPARDDDLENWSGADVSSADEGGRDQNGSAKRKRPLSVSCETCKQRKVKCDRGHPSCGWCLKNSQACTYLPRKKPGLRAGYGRELEARLDKLESLLQQQQAQISQLSSNQIQHSVSAQAPPSQEHGVFRNPPIIQTPHVPRPETALFLQKPSTFPTQHQPTIQADYGAGLGGARQAQPVAPHNGYQPAITGDDGHHPLGSLTTPREVYSPVAQRHYQHMPGQVPHANIGQQDDDFPAYDVLYGLVDLFFKHIYPWCPILHRATTFSCLFGEGSLDEADRILLHAIVATTLKFATDPRLTPEKKQHYHQTSKQKVLLYGIENSSVKSLQALVILSLDVIGCSNGPPGWNLLALITRSVVQLGLSMETSSPMVAPQFASIYTLRAIVLPEPKDWIEEESRRRLFWIIYILDRYATVATAFEFALDDKEIDRRLPCRDELFNQNRPVETRWFPTPSRSEYTMNRPENLGSFSYYIEILGILSRIHKFLKKPVNITSLTDVEKWRKEYHELHREIEEWKYHLPPELGNAARVFPSPGVNRALNSGLVMLHAAFHTTVIRLHSSAAYPTHRSEIFKPSFQATKRCLEAVEAITALCNAVRDNGLLTKLGPPFAFSLWVAARVLLVHGSTIDHNVDSAALSLLVSTLQEIGTYWEVGTRYANLLSRVLSEYQESQRLAANSNGEHVHPPTVKILADMRRCAFDLDFLISRQPKLGSGGGSAMGRGTVTPARTPAPNELEYLDVFDFFNMPRLPATMDGAMSYAGGSVGPGAQGGGLGGLHLGDAGHQGSVGSGSGTGVVGGGGVAAAWNESGVTTYMADEHADWFMKGGNG